jgi:hypothetical protein
MWRLMQEEESVSTDIKQHAQLQLEQLLQWTYCHPQRFVF